MNETPTFTVLESDPTFVTFQQAMDAIGCDEAKLCRLIKGGRLRTRDPFTNNVKGRKACQVEEELVKLVIIEHEDHLKHTRRRRSGSERERALNISLSATAIKKRKTNKTTIGPIYELDESTRDLKALIAKKINDIHSDADRESVYRLKKEYTTALKNLGITPHDNDEEWLRWRQENLSKKEVRTHLNIKLKTLRKLIKLGVLIEGEGDLISKDSVDAYRTVPASNVPTTAIAMRKRYLERRKKNE